jgi:hypothetical protein
MRGAMNFSKKIFLFFRGCAAIPMKPSAMKTSDACRRRVGISEKIELCSVLL